MHVVRALARRASDAAALARWPAAGRRAGPRARGRRRAGARLRVGGRAGARAVLRWPRWPGRGKMVKTGNFTERAPRRGHRGTVGTLG